MNESHKREMSYEREVCVETQNICQVEKSMRWSCSSRNCATTRFYVDLEDRCKRRAAKEVSELKTTEEGNGSREEELRTSDQECPGIPRLPNFLKDENINRIETCLSEYYMETVYQKLWENAQNAVFQGTNHAKCKTYLP